jgi:sugar lactone lactonase YvrE
MTEPRIVNDALVMGESPRWHDGRLWVADWGAREVVALDPATGAAEVVVADAPPLPFCFDFAPDGALLLVDGRGGRLLRRAPGEAAFALHAGLTGVCAPPWNDIVADARGNAYVNATGFDFPGAEFAPGFVALVTAGGAVARVADGLAFPNGMAITDDGATLVVAESYGHRLTAFAIGDDGTLAERRVWADLDDGVPDGICVDAEGAIWYADVPGRCCVRVREGGDVVGRVALDRGGFACMLGGAGGATLFAVTSEWRGPEAMPAGRGAGQVVAVDAPAAHAGRP